MLTTIRTSRTLALLAAVPLLAALAWTAPAAQAATPGDTNYNGYVAMAVNSHGVPTTRYTGVQAKWTVPAAQNTHSGQAAQWVGLGGIGGTTANGAHVSSTPLVQVGTILQSGSTASYSAVWEVVDSPFAVAQPLPAADAVHLGDQMAGTVRCLGGGVYNLELANLTAGWAWNTNYTTILNTRWPTSAEWIVEVPKVQPGNLPGTWANFGSVPFSSASYATATGMHDLAAGAGVFPLVSGVADNDTTVSPISGGAFTVTYNTVPSLPYDLQAVDATSTSIQVTWKDPGNRNVDGYVLGVQGPGFPPNGTAVDLPGAGTLSYTWTGLTPGTTYYFFVASKFYGSGTPTGWGNIQSVWVGFASATTSPSP